ncbi:hypothetical protein GQ55_5G255900 [Panicum hallii var. hallii]|uniref:Uncharacterized protein n=1 Tax=Panicum hallii var. hallii TaxID=1504633 RepID=A0A2T7DK60_9POAL|nr:hypothetical protein GQ55_5G255900 [Panicum hallii var. hallii]
MSDGRYCGGSGLAPSFSNSLICHMNIHSDSSQVCTWIPKGQGAGVHAQHSHDDHPHSTMRWMWILQVCYARRRRGPGPRAGAASLGVERGASQSLSMQVQLCRCAAGSSEPPIGPLAPCSLHLVGNAGGSRSQQARPEGHFCTPRARLAGYPQCLKIIGPGNIPL